MRKSLSGCVLVKNEEMLLPNFLDQLKNFVDEIVLVDNGSKDNTIEIAQAYGCVIIRDFSSGFDKVRNRYIEAATKDWILVLDPDERILSVDFERLRDLIDMMPDDIGLCSLPRVDYIGNGHWAWSYQARLFRNNKNIHYNDTSIHAFVRDSVKAIGLKSVLCDIMIHHFDAFYKKRAAQKRNDYINRLYKEIDASKPETYYLYNLLGLEYSAQKNFAKAREFFDICGDETSKLFKAQTFVVENMYEEANEVLSEVPVENLSSKMKGNYFNLKSHISFYLGDYREAISWCERAINLEPHAPHLHLNHAMYSFAYNPTQTITDIETAVRLNPLLLSKEIYRNGSDDNLFIQQDAIVKKERDFFWYLLEACRITQNMEKLSYWTKKTEILL